jgi:hypothetical protein
VTARSSSPTFSASSASAPARPTTRLFETALAVRWQMESC